MSVYIVIYLSIIYLFIIETLITKKNRIGIVNIGETTSWSHLLSIVFSIVLLVLFFISSFRSDTIGADHRNYIHEFYNIKKTGDAYFDEKGYVLLNKIVAWIGGETLMLSLAINSIFFAGFAKYIKKYVSPTYYLLSIIIFVFQPYLYVQCSFNIVRQACAIGVLLLFMEFLVEEKYLYFIIGVVVAYTFHQAMIGLIVLLVVKKIRWTKKTIIVAAVISLVANFFNLSTIIFKLSSSLLNYGTKGINYDSSVLNNKMYVLLVFGVVLYFANNYESLYDNKMEKLFVDLFIFSLIFMIFSVQNDLMYRVYIGLAFVAIPGLTLVYNKSNTIIKILFVLYYSSFFLGYFGRLWLIQDQAYVPFRFIFNEWR